MQLQLHGLVWLEPHVGANMLPNREVITVKNLKACFRMKQSKSAESASAAAAAAAAKTILTLSGDV